MNRLQAELQRLYGAPDPTAQEPGATAPCLIGADGRVRALVLELARPAPWDAGARTIWQGVQADLELPAPAIAVSGTDSYQLWFSLAQPVAPAQARAFLESLRIRYLGTIPPHRVALHPGVDPAAPARARHIGGTPPAERTPGCWSAFVAPDLAALFADETWLDTPPGADAQAELLARLQSTQPADFERALERLKSAAAPERAQPPSRLATAAPDNAADPAALPSPLAGGPDPRAFLLGVMNDPAIDLRLRIEAAKALLPHFEHPRPT